MDRYKISENDCGSDGKRCRPGQLFFVMKKSKPQKSVRPTTSKAREALFDILRSRIKNARFLDLYAGTGAVGIEALKEGASEVVFVEGSRTNLKKLNETISRYNVEEKSRVIIKKALSFIETAEQDDQLFDIIFLDPPYHSDEVDLAMSTIGSSSILDAEGTVIAEHFKKKRLSDRFNNLKKTKEYNYGDTVFTFYKKSGNQE
jgi:16S rRNA (guanine966-N2)-methyltransferase